MPSTHPQLRIGTSGWTYKPWRHGAFYPEGLPARRELEHVSRRLNSLEINGTFYSLQRPSTFRRWADETPRGFVFAVKGGRYITHLKRLKDIRGSLANFFASGPLELGPKLGPILWQLPPNMKFDPDRLNEFFDVLPRTTAAAAELARERTLAKLDEPVATPATSRPLRYALEFRHESFLVPEFPNLLRRRGIAMVIADTAGKHPLREDITAPFVYIRLHGSTQLYVSGYTEAELDRWADRITLWHRGREPSDASRIGAPALPRPSGRDVYVYFDNTDNAGLAALNAESLAHRLRTARSRYAA